VITGSISPVKVDQEDWRYRSEKSVSANLLEPGEAIQPLCGLLRAAVKEISGVG
jgi:hypothetical protein